MATNPLNLKQKIFLIITGASRGIGQRTAIELAHYILPESQMLLLARSVDGLENTRKQIQHINGKINVDIHGIDLTRPTNEEIQSCFEKSLTNLSQYDVAMIIHNVGTLGDVKTLAKDLNDPLVWRDYFDINVFSIAITNSVFMKLFSSIRKVVVNITSLCAIKPFERQTLYCSARAAREMFFKVLASEEKDTLVLNYSPGPVDTDMTVTLQSDSFSTDIRQMFSNLRETKTILTTEQTTKKMIEVLINGKYESGSRVDYYDKI